MLDASNIINLEMNIFFNWLCKNKLILKEIVYINGAGIDFVSA